MLEPISQLFPAARFPETTVLACRVGLAISNEESLQRLDTGVDTHHCSVLFMFRSMKWPEPRWTVLVMHCTQNRLSLLKRQTILLAWM